MKIILFFVGQQDNLLQHWRHAPYTVHTIVKVFKVRPGLTFQTRRSETWKIPIDWLIKVWLKIKPLFEQVNRFNGQIFHLIVNLYKVQSHISASLTYLRSWGQVSRSLVSWACNRSFLCTNWLPCTAPVYSSISRCHHHFTLSAPLPVPSFTLTSLF